VTVSELDPVLYFRFTKKFIFNDREIIRISFNLNDFRETVFLYGYEWKMQYDVATTNYQ